jgi:glycosyltransferase involved in cell wall biosynthesis
MAVSAKRTVAIDIGKVFGPMDGVARYTAGLVRGLAKLETGLPPRERLAVRLYSIYQELPREDFRELLVERLGELPEGFELMLERVPGPVAADLLHCTSHSVPSSWCGPLVFTIYDLSFLSMPTAHTLHNRVHCNVGLARALARRAQLVAISETTRDALAQQLRVEPSQVTVAPPAADARFAPQNEAVVRLLRSRCGLPERFVLSVGTLEPRKNLPALIEAYRRLPADLRSDCPLVLAGGEGWGDVLAGAISAPLEDASGEIRVLGIVDDEDLPALYASATVFAYPSLLEGFGLPALEAMACGVPVLVGDSSSLPEVVGDAALKVDVTDPAAIAQGLERLLTDPGFAGQLGRAGTSRARYFSWQSTAERMHELYWRLLDERARAPVSGRW